MAIKRKPNVPFKRKPLDLPPEVGRAFIKDIRASSLSDMPATNPQSPRSGA
jgi:hypothetical protein